jgi:multidrug efflux system membrane fusion protein
VIQTRQAQTGQFVQRGATIATLLRRDPLLLRFNVPSVDVAKIKNGMTARFNVAGLEQSFRATIFHVAEQAESSSRMVTITARIVDPNRDQLTPGTFAEVTVPIDSGVENPVILQAAVRPSERGFLAFVVEKGTARERLVKLGLRTSDGQVEVRSGLNPGDMLVVQGSDAMRDGVEVEVEPKKSGGASRSKEAGAPSTTTTTTTMPAKTRGARRP